MEDNKRISDLEQQIKKLMQRLAKLETQNIEKTRTIRSLKTKISDLEYNVEAISALLRRK
jgi:predicted  nucleic acid-binding Zn-ribbon protein